MEVDVTRALEEMIGLPDVVFLGLEVEPSGVLLVHVEGRSPRAFCEHCGIAARVEMVATLRTSSFLTLSSLALRATHSPMHATISSIVTGESTAPTWTKAEPIFPWLVQSGDKYHR